jgi:hypothetical protein
VKKKGRLDDSVRDAWYNASGGNSAFAALAFMLSQRNAIGGGEVVDAAAFRHTATTDMAFLQPAIAALRNRAHNELAAFDDLVFSPRYRDLRHQMGVKESPSRISSNEEFDDLAGNTEVSVSRPRKMKKPTGRAETTFDGSLPSEDPLARGDYERSHAA